VLIPLVHQLHTFYFVLNPLPAPARLSSSQAVRGWGLGAVRWTATWCVPQVGGAGAVVGQGCVDACERIALKQLSTLSY
jgi:hypothetical protein